jgi:hypothetical protein
MSLKGQVLYLFYHTISLYIKAALHFLNMFSFYVDCRCAECRYAECCGAPTWSIIALCQNCDLTARTEESRTSKSDICFWKKFKFKIA